LVPIPHCRYCWKPLKEDFKDWGICYDCNKQPSIQNGLPDRLFAATLYIPDVTKGYPHNHEITDLKEHGTYSDIYAEMLVIVLEKEGFEVNEGVIVPIPQTKVRPGTAGPLALAESLSKLTSLPVCRCLRFIRPVRSQKGLSKNERGPNMENSMTADSWGDAGTTILVDDIMTTCSTMIEGTRALKAAGARDVIGLTAARDAGIRSLEYAGVVKRVES